MNVSIKNGSWADFLLYSGGIAVSTVLVAVYVAVTILDGAL